MEEELQKLGLNENEAKVYLAALSLGPSTASKLAEFTNIKRPTVYLALEGLAKLGIVSETFAQKKRLFRAEKPEKLEKLTKRMRRQVIDAEQVLENLLPSLKNLPGQSAEEPQVEFHSGIEGLKNVALEISACPSSWYFFGSSTKILEKILGAERMDILHDSWALRKDPNRPKIYLISDSGFYSLGGVWEKTKTPWREMRVLPQTINAHSGLFIYEDKIAVISFEHQPFAAIIKSRQVAEVVKIMHTLIWKSLPESKF